MDHELNWMELPRRQQVSRRLKARCEFNKLGLHKGAPLKRRRWLLRLAIWQMSDKLAAREAHWLLRWRRTS